MNPPCQHIYSDGRSAHYTPRWFWNYDWQSSGISSYSVKNMDCCVLYPFKVYAPICISLHFCFYEIQQKLLFWCWRFKHKKGTHRRVRESAFFFKRHYLLLKCYPFICRKAECCVCLSLWKELDLFSTSNVRLVTLGPSECIIWLNLMYTFFFSLIFYYSMIHFTLSSSIFHFVISFFHDGRDEIVSLL